MCTRILPIKSSKRLGLFLDSGLGRFLDDFYDCQVFSVTLLLLVRLELRFLILFVTIQNIALDKGLIIWMTTFLKKILTI